MDRPTHHLRPPRPQYDRRRHYAGLERASAAAALVLGLLLFPTPVRRLFAAVGWPDGSVVTVLLLAAVAWLAVLMASYLMRMLGLTPRGLLQLLNALARALVGLPIDDVYGAPTPRLAARVPVKQRLLTEFHPALLPFEARGRSRQILYSLPAVAVATWLALAGLAAADPLSGSARGYWLSLRVIVDNANIAAILDRGHYIAPAAVSPILTLWAVLPWDLAFFMWALLSGSLLLLTIVWAYQRSPLAVSLLLVVLAYPMGAAVGSGSAVVYAAVALFVAQRCGARMGGFLWALSMSTSFLVAPYWLILPARSRAWGLAWLAVLNLVSLMVAPLTVLQIEVLTGWRVEPGPAVALAIWATVPLLMKAGLLPQNLPQSVMPLRRLRQLSIRGASGTGRAAGGSGFQRAPRSALRMALSFAGILPLPDLTMLISPETRRRGRTDRMERRASR